MTKDERIALCEGTVTLDGEEAMVSGYSLPFARVTGRTSLRSFEWAWETVARIRANGGRFQS